MLNIHNFVYYLNIMYVICIKLCTLNVQKYVHSLKKWMLNRHSYIRWVYMIVYNYTLFEKCVPWMYKIIYIIQKTSMNYTHIIKIVYIESTKFHILFENCVHFFEKWVYIYILWGQFLLQRPRARPCWNLRQFCCPT